MLMSMTTPIARLSITSMSRPTPTVYETAILTMMDTNMRMAMLTATTMSTYMQTDPVMRMLMDMSMRMMMTRR
jgi:hypothetical protein